METLGKSKILVVEDDVLQRFIAKSVLSEKYEVETASNGYEALEMVEKNDYGFVLMDINLGDPSMDGIKVMRMMRQHRKYKHTKIVAVTAFAHLREWYISEGFNELIVKPILSDTIFEMLDKVPNVKNVYCFA
ncbi:MAG: response regulator [Bacteroidota bacterium]